ncbi:hypothetical protein MNBD_GAMMA15-2176 [hydrothermal vent metagenome]|uniref:Uncharacterized protein n=1 Tax=hydrothermal vent metagenome TaxID=652676 RepID=A0A3B0YQE4_9ZZZZ
MHKWMLVTCLSSLIMACSPPSDDAADATSKTEKPPEHVWQDQVETLDKAREVEKTLLDAQKRRDAEMP